MNTTRFAVVGLLAACAFVGCANRPKGPVVARVGESVLTLDELYKSIPPEYSDFITREQVVSYVKQWIDNKVLYDEALRLKIDKEEPIRERLRRMKEDLLCAEMVSRSAASSQATKVGEEAIESYFNGNRAKFVRQTNVAKFLQIVCGDMNTAAKVHALATADNFTSLAAQYSKVPQPDAKSIPYVKLSDLPPEFAQEIISTKINGTTGVVKTDAGFCVARVLDKQPKGTPCELAEVKEDIATVLAARMQNAAVEHLISSLRTKMRVEANLDLITEQRASSQDATPQSAPSIPSDSSQKESRE
jgi:PPIC-type PPIASE domain